MDEVRRKELAHLLCRRQRLELELHLLQTEFTQAAVAFNEAAAKLIPDGQRIVLFAGHEEWIVAHKSSEDDRAGWIAIEKL